MAVTVEITDCVCLTNAQIRVGTGLKSEPAGAVTFIDIHRRSETRKDQIEFGIAVDVRRLDFIRGKEREARVRPNLPGLAESASPVIEEQESIGFTIIGLG